EVPADAGVGAAPAQRLHASGECTVETSRHPAHREGAVVAFNGHAPTARTKDAMHLGKCSLGARKMSKQEARVRRIERGIGERKGLGVGLHDLDDSARLFENLSIIVDADDLEPWATRPQAGGDESGPASHIDEPSLIGQSYGGEQLVFER